MMPDWFTIQDQKSIIMKQRFILFRRADVFYCEDTTTRKQTSLHTKDRDDALRVLHAKNEAELQPAINLQIARAYLTASDAADRGRVREQVVTVGRLLVGT